MIRSVVRNLFRNIFTAISTGSNEGGAGQRPYPGLDSSAPVIRWQDDFSVLTHNVVSNYTETAEITVQFWFKSQGELPGAETLLSCANESGSAPAFLIDAMAGSLGFRFLGYDNAGAAVQNRRWDDASVHDGEWHHVAISYNFAEQYLLCRIDGVLKTGVDAGGAPVWNAIRAKATVSIGSKGNLKPQSTTYSKSFAIRQLALWDHSADISDDLVWENLFFDPANPKTPVNLGDDGVLPFSDRAMVYVNRDANAINAGQVTGKWADTHTYRMSGRGVENDWGSKELVYRVPQVLDEADIAGVTVLGDGDPTYPARIDDADNDAYGPLPNIFGQAIRLSHGGGVVPNIDVGIRIDSIGHTPDDADAELPTWAIFWNNNINPSAFYTLRVFHSAADTTNYTEYRYSESPMVNGWHALPIIPQLCLAELGSDVAEFSGYLPRGCTVTNAGTGWTGKNIDRVEILLEGHHATRYSTGTTRWSVATYQGLVKVYGHTPTIVHNVDDGTKSIYDVQNVGDGSVPDVTNPTTVQKLAHLGIPFCDGLIWGSGYSGNSLTEAMMSEMEDSQLWEWTVHNSYGFATEIFSLQCNVFNPFEYGEVVTQFNDAGPGLMRHLVTLKNVYPDEVMKDVMLLGFNAGDVPAGVQFVIDGWQFLIGDVAGTGSTGSGTCEYVTNPDWFAAVFDVHKQRIIDTRDVLTGVDHFLMARGSYRTSSKQQVNSAVSRCFAAIPGLKTHRPTAGFGMGIPNLVNFGDAFWERYQIGATSIEAYGTASGANKEFDDMNAIIDGRLSVTIPALGGGWYHYLHTPIPVGGTVVSSSLPIVDLFAYLDKIADMRDAGKIVPLFLSEYYDRLVQTMPMGNTLYADYFDESLFPELGLPATPPTPDPVVRNENYGFFLAMGSGARQQDGLYLQVDIDECNAPNCNGVVFKYDWASLQPTDPAIDPAAYAKSLIDADFAMLPPGKSAWVFINWQYSYSGSLDPTPSWLEPQYKLNNGRATAPAVGITPAIWEPRVYNALIDLVEAIAADYDEDPRFEGVQSQESSLGDAEAPTVEQMRDCMKLIGTGWSNALPNSNVSLYINFLSALTGGNDRWSFISDVYAYIIANSNNPENVFMGGPDWIEGVKTLQPDNRSYGERRAMYADSAFDALGGYTHTFQNDSYRVNTGSSPRSGSTWSADLDTEGNIAHPHFLLRSMMRRSALMHPVSYQFLNMYQGYPADGTGGQVWHYGLVFGQGLTSGYWEGVYEDMYTLLNSQDNYPWRQDINLLTDRRGFTDFTLFGVTIGASPDTDPNTTGTGDSTQAKLLTMTGSGLHYISITQPEGTFTNDARFGLSMKPGGYRYVRVEVTKEGGQDRSMILDLQTGAQQSISVKDRMLFRQGEFQEWIYCEVGEDVANTGGVSTYRVYILDNSLNDTFAASGDGIHIFEGNLYEDWMPSGGSAPPPISVQQQPQPEWQDVSNGQTGSVTVTATNVATYTWQAYDQDTKSWYDIPHAPDSATYTTPELHINSWLSEMIVRCKMRGIDGNLTWTRPSRIAAQDIFFGTDYFFDAELGDDSNAGTEAAPFKTIAGYINNVGWTATNRLRFKRGQRHKWINNPQNNFAAYEIPASVTGAIFFTDYGRDLDRAWWEGGEDRVYTGSEDDVFLAFGTTYRVKLPKPDNNSYTHHGVAAISYDGGDTWRSLRLRGWTEIGANAGGVGPGEMAYNKNDPYANALLYFRGHNDEDLTDPNVIVQISTQRRPSGTAKKAGKYSTQFIMSYLGFRLFSRNPGNWFDCKLGVHHTFQTMLGGDVADPVGGGVQLSDGVYDSTEVLGLGIHHNIVDDVWDAGFSPQFFAGATRPILGLDFYENLISRCGWQGIECSAWSNESSIYAADVRIARNTIWGGGTGFGGQTKPGDGNGFDDRRNDSGGIRVTTYKGSVAGRNQGWQDMIIEDNYIYDNMGAAINLRNAGNYEDSPIIVRRNRMAGNIWGFTISNDNDLFKPTPAHVYSNWFENNNKPVILAGAQYTNSQSDGKPYDIWHNMRASNVDINYYKNTLVGSIDGVGFSRHDQACTSTVRFKYNVMAGNGTGVDYRVGIKGSVPNKEFSENVAWAFTYASTSSDIKGNPNFVSQDDFTDLRLDEGSLAIGAGAGDVGWDVNDFDNQPHAIGDAGAFRSVLTGTLEVYSADMNAVDPAIPHKHIVYQNQTKPVVGGPGSMFPGGTSDWSIVPVSHLQALGASMEAGGFTDVMLDVEYYDDQPGSEYWWLDSVTYRAGAVDRWAQAIEAIRDGGYTGKLSPYNIGPRMGQETYLWNEVRLYQQAFRIEQLAAEIELNDQWEQDIKDLVPLFDYWCFSEYGTGLWLNEYPLDQIKAQTVYKVQRRLASFQAVHGGRLGTAIPEFIITNEYKTGPTATPPNTWTDFPDSWMEWQFGYLSKFGYRTSVWVGDGTGYLPLSASHKAIMASYASNY